MKRSLYHYVVFVVFLDLFVLIDRLLMARCSMSVLSPARIDRLIVGIN